MTASIANVVAAISARICAIASCLPIGWPHCTRSFAHLRQISRQRLAGAAQDAGSVSRPVFSVTSASFRPLPSPQSRFSFGTRTLVKRMTPFSIAFSPMKWQRMHDLDAGPVLLDDEGRDLLRVGVPRHDDEELGDGAVGAPELLAVQDVVAVGRLASPSSRGSPDPSRRRPRSARTPRRRRARGAASTSSSAPSCRRASAAAARRSTGAPRAARSRLPSWLVTSFIASAYSRWVKPEAAVLLRDLDAEGAQLREPLDDARRDLPLAVDRVGVHLLDEEPLDALA